MNTRKRNHFHIERENDASTFCYDGLLCCGVVLSRWWCSCCCCCWITPPTSPLGHIFGFVPSQLCETTTIIWPDGFFNFIPPSWWIGRKFWFCCGTGTVCISIRSGSSIIATTDPWGSAGTGFTNRRYWSLVDVVFGGIIGLFLSVILAKADAILVNNADKTPKSL